MPPLHAVAYVSTATARLSASESIDALLVDARAFNATCGVTGALLHHGGSFFQYFEGPPDGVGMVYERIRASRGHKGLYELLNNPIRERHFADWTMGFAEPVRSDLQRISQAAWSSQLAQAARQTTRSPGLMLLLDFWARCRRQQ